LTPFGVGLANPSLEVGIALEAAWPGDLGIEAIGCQFRGQVLTLARQQAGAWGTRGLRAHVK